MLYDSTINTESQKQQNEVPKMGSFTPTMSTIVEARLCNMEERIHQLIHFSSTF